MRFFLFSILLMLIFFAFFSESEAEPITLGYTESVVNTAGGDPALQYCTIYKCKGKTCTDWQPIKLVSRSSVNGGGVRSEQIIVPLSASDLPVSYRLAYTCTTVTGNTSDFLIPNLASGNPITFEGS
jgi:hypothetical protein